MKFGLILSSYDVFHLNVCNAAGSQGEDSMLLAW